MVRKKSSSRSSGNAVKDLDIDGLKSQFDQLRSDLDSLLDAVTDAKSDRSGMADFSLRHELLERMGQLQESIAYAKERGEQAIETAQHRIEERPLLSVVIAFGVGLLAGKVFGRGDRG